MAGRDSRHHVAGIRVLPGRRANRHRCEIRHPRRRRLPGPQAPSSGGPSPEQAARYLRCEQESRTNDAISLLEHLKVEVARGRPYEHVTDSWEAIDPRQPVYPIRGSYTGYTCDAVYTPQQVASGFAANGGRNCSAYENPQASGVCYRTSFGDWRCRMYDIHADPVGTTRRRIPPP